MNTQNIRKWTPRWLALGLAFAMLGAQAALAAPTVTTMPDGIRAATQDTAYAWAGKSIRFWGRTAWGASTSGTYEINFGDGSALVTGAVTNQHDTGAAHAYAVAGTYFATLKVTDGNGDSHISTTRIDVIPAVDKKAQTNLAIERGLKNMYDRYVALGRTGAVYGATSSYSGAQTAAALLAFENRGHKPALDEDSDGDIDAADRAILESKKIYAELVHKALNYTLSTLTSTTATTEEGENPDTNANGYVVYPNDGYPPYTAGMYMMALVGAGNSDGNPATPDAGSIVATTGPAGRVLGRTLHDIVQDMVDFCAQSQNDPSRGVYNGGWRYYPDYGSSDNSVSQWCPIGMDEATVRWGNPIPSWVKTRNLAWTNYSQNAAGYFGYTSSGMSSVDYSSTETGSGLCQLGFQGVAQTDPRVVKAQTWLASNYAVHFNGSAQNIYGMYAVTKGLRGSKDGSGNRRPIDLIGTPATVDWYDAYATKLIGSQLAGGDWADTAFVSSYIFETAWAVEILTPALTGQPPVAEAGGPYDVPPNTNVNLDGTGSHHEDPAKFLVKYEWDFDADNGLTFTDALGPLATITGGFVDKGFDYSKIVALRVTDNVGDTDIDTANVNIKSGNIAPIANPGGPYKGAVGVPITLDGSGSTDPNAGAPTCGTIVKYEWDLDGNGSFEVDGGASPTISNTWTTPYFGFIGLRVTDDCGAPGTSKVYAEVSVSDLRPLGDINGDGKPDAYAVVKETRLTRYVFEYEVKMTLVNLGSGAAQGVTAALQDFPSNVTVVDGELTFGDIGVGAMVQSGDSFKIRVDRRITTSDRDLKWRVAYTAAGVPGVITIVVPWF